MVTNAASTRGARKPRAPRKFPAQLKRAARRRSLPKAPSKKETDVPFPKTKIELPDIGVDAVVVSGVDEESLRRGPRPFSRHGAAPDKTATASSRRIATFTARGFTSSTNCFPGQSIYLETPQGKYEYRVVRVFLNADTDTALLQSPPADASGKIPAQLTLITCTTPRTTNRLVLIAQRPKQSDY